MMRHLVLIATFLAAFAGSTASATPYLTVEGSSMNVDGGLSGELNPTGIRFRFGTPVGKNLDVEAHLGFATDLKTTVFDEFTSVSTGVYLKAYLPIGFNSAFYGLGGFSRVNFEQTVNGVSFEEERGGLSYGAGFETRLSKRLDLTADYIQHVSDDGEFDDVSTVSFGLKFYF